MGDTKPTYDKVTEEDYFTKSDSDEDLTEDIIKNCRTVEDLEKTLRNLREKLGIQDEISNLVSVISEIEDAPSALPLVSTINLNGQLRKQALKYVERPPHVTTENKTLLTTLQMQIGNMQATVLHNECLKLLHHEDSAQVAKNNIRKTWAKLAAKRALAFATNIYISHTTKMEEALAKIQV